MLPLMLMTVERRCSRRLQNARVNEGEMSVVAVMRGGGGLA
jgi:hypothetical protein